MLHTLSAENDRIPFFYQTEIWENTNEDMLQKLSLWENWLPHLSLYSNHFWLNRDKWTVFLAKPLGNFTFCKYPLLFLIGYLVMLYLFDTSSILASLPDYEWVGENKTEHQNYPKVTNAWCIRLKVEGHAALHIHKVTISTCLASFITSTNYLVSFVEMGKIWPKTGAKKVPTWIRPL